MIYIAGPMTGIPYCNHPLFYAVEKLLTFQGLECFNPAKHGGSLTGEHTKTGKIEDLPEGMNTYKKLLSMDLGAVIWECDSIVLLDGWQNSKGARAELMLALALGHTVYTYETGSTVFVKINACLDAGVSLAFNSIQGYIDGILK